MSNPTLKLLIAPYDHVKPLAEGTIKLRGINLDVAFSEPSETFWLMLKSDNHDISEMSLSSYLIAKSQGRDWTAVPIFPFRAFFHTNFYINKNGTIKEPSDLEGKKVGLTEYQVTMALWARGVLQHEFGVNLKNVNWYVERWGSLSHGGQTAFVPPRGIRIQKIPSGQTLQSLLESGKLDAILPSFKSKLNRTDKLNFKNSAKIQNLFDDPKAEAIRYYKKTGLLHMNHTVIIRGPVARKYTLLAKRVYRTFEDAKQLAQSRFIEHASKSRTPLVLAAQHIDEETKLFGNDPIPYGIKANRRVLETLVSYSSEQGLIAKKLELEDLFHKSTLNT